MTHHHSSADNVQLQAKMQQAIMAHPFFEGSATLAFGLAGAAMKAIPAVPQTVQVAAANAGAFEQVFRDACDEAHCAYDNEALLSAIKGLREGTPQTLPDVEAIHNAIAQALLVEGLTFSGVRRAARATLALSRPQRVPQ
jgi:hypothetical protein